MANEKPKYDSMETAELVSGFIRAWRRAPTVDPKEVEKTLQKLKPRTDELPDELMSAYMGSIMGIVLEKNPDMADKFMAALEEG